MKKIKKTNNEGYGPRKDLVAWLTNRFLKGQVETRATKRSSNSLNSCTFIKVSNNRNLNSGR